MLFAGCFVALLLAIRVLLLYAAPKSIQHHRAALFLQRRDFEKELQSAEVGICPALLSQEDVSKLDPSIDLALSWKNTDGETTIDNINRLDFDALKAQPRPTITWNGQKRTEYTIVFLDMDAPYGRNDARNPSTQYLHWIVSHVDPTTFEQSELGEQTVPYVPPTPPPSSTSGHRYVLVILAEGKGTPRFPVSIPKGTNQTSGEEAVDRPNFNFKSFKEDNFLSPAAVEYFISSQLAPTV